MPLLARRWADPVRPADVLRMIFCQFQAFGSRRHPGLATRQRCHYDFRCHWPCPRAFFRPNASASSATGTRACTTELGRHGSTNCILILSVVIGH
eukprot:9471192-Pyramimonas_sp.AAC.1